MKYLLILLLSGCANTGAWSDKPVRLPVTVLAVVHADYPCTFKNWNGCWNEAGRTIEIKKGLSVADEHCVKTHEYKHAAGYTHGDQSHYYRLDCGGA